MRNIPIPANWFHNKNHIFYLAKIQLYDFRDEIVWLFLSSNVNFPRSVVGTFFVKANLFLRGVSPARRKDFVECLGLFQ